MFLIRNIRSHNLKFTPISKNVRKYSVNRAAPYTNTILIENNEELIETIKKHAPKLIYNSVVDRKRLLRYGFKTNSIILSKLNKQEERLKMELRCQPPIPISLKYLSDDDDLTENNLSSHSDELNFEPNNQPEEPLHFPFKSSHGIDPDFVATTTPEETEMIARDIAEEANEEVRKRFELKREIKNWMTSYDNYDDSLVSDEDDEDSGSVSDWKVNYGTPDPTSEISNVACGGCGALLHCKDTAIPGYIPSEIFKSRTPKGGANLEAIICQRCYFLKYYNLALQMQVSPDDYPKVLASVSERHGLVVLMVDLLDFPCSIWPGIADIFSRKMPIVVVGNKVDLLPKDSKKYLERVKKTLLDQVKLSGFATLNIKHVALISAKTGYGVEDLITCLNSFYRHRGDVFIVGCTNVGKSSLFNAFLQSDYCKIQAMDLLQRATTSVWPGTTLNLLKFPIKRPAGYRQYLRHKRLEESARLATEENRMRQEQLRKTKDPKFATLIGHIDVTHHPYRTVDESQDSFSIRGHANASGKFKMGINENLMEYAHSKWCYDTPGVVQPDQILPLLTTEELLLTLPKELVMPRSFCLKPGMSLFIAGLSRLDYLDGFKSVRLTVFASEELPITVCRFEDADGLYEDLLGSELFKIPVGNAERLARWPKLEMARKFDVKGESWNKSVIDVVLSSSGWIAITGREGKKYEFQAWAPEKRGVYLRDCLLPHAISLRGSRIRHSVAYGKHRFYTKDD